jgi:DNA-binding transcriptional ArsR family regulator
VTKDATERAPNELIDARLAKALAHPLRVRLLAALNKGPASPNQLAEQVEEPLQNVSYHIRVLNGLGCIELVRTAQRRGAIEHFYRAIMRPFFDDSDWKRLPISARHSVSDIILQLVWDDAARALAAGSFDEREERHLSRSPLALDDQGWEDLTELLAETLERAHSIQAESADRCSKAGDEPFNTRLVLMHFPAAPSADKPKRRKRG